ncbi:helix-turn-helix transcriptional regulator [Nonomuraea antri]|uniref:helix-turn-helix transcriptional regulator n=1 Tax=Nonomuraea antri TaxID=2730852 RepID=UPI001C2BD9FA|nr:transcriptional regulator [Nonomuraea antri]
MSEASDDRDASAADACATDAFAADVASVAALSEPVRQALYAYVVAQEYPVSRENAAEGVGVAHHVAKFNLDKLVAEGLLDVEYSRPPGRGGPGAGRPAKMYRRAARDIAVTLPERRYDLAGQVLAEAVTIAARDDVPVQAALSTAARSAGHRIGETAAARREAAPDREVGTRQAVADTLARHGYEPRAGHEGLVLANCPFHRLAQSYTELVCGMNLDLIDGVIERLCPGSLRARLNPGPGRCCVTIDGEVSSPNAPGALELGLQGSVGDPQADVVSGGRSRPDEHRHVDEP